jgi:hypothetical protein
MHWVGGHKPEWRAEHLVGCHFLEQPREPPSCWRVDPSTAHYETVASTAGPNSANGWVHEAPSETKLLSYALLHANREGPPTGETTGVHRHGDVTVRIPPRGPLRLCKARRCKTYPGNEALVTNDWSLLIAYAYDDASTTYVAIDVAAGKQLARITTGPTRTGKATISPTTISAARMMAVFRNTIATLEHVQLLESQVAQGNGRAIALDCIGERIIARRAGVSIVLAAGG